MPKTKLQRTRITFAGVEFSGIVRGADYITVPAPALRKILNGGRCIAACDYRYTDDYAGDAADNFGKGPVSNKTVEQSLDLGKPNLCYFSPKDGTIRFSPYQALAYTISELNEPIGVDSPDSVE
jgi:hypothetical protein